MNVKETKALLQMREVCGRSMLCKIFMVWPETQILVLSWMPATGEEIKIRRIDLMNDQDKINETVKYLISLGRDKGLVEQYAHELQAFKHPIEMSRGEYVSKLLKEVFGVKGDKEDEHDESKS